MNALRDYVPRAGLSIPIVTILDPAGHIIEDEQRALVRFAIQEGQGADIVFAVGTTGEWDRIDNSRRQQAARIAVEECGSLNRTIAHHVEAWVGVTAPTVAETVANLAYAIELNADAAVVAPLSIADLDDGPADFVESDLSDVFERAGRSIPVFLYDNAEIAVAGRPAHLHTADVKRMSRLDYVRGIKVTASKAVLGNYTRAASNFKLAHEFAIYAGNAHLIFDLFAPPDGMAARLKHRWNRYWTQRALPHGVVSGPANAMPREWQRGWQVCREGNRELMARYEKAIADFRAASTFIRGGREYRPTIACLKAALKELGVCHSDAVAPGTADLNREERREFAARFAALRDRLASALEPDWISRYEPPRAPGALRAV